MKYPVSLCALIVLSACTQTTPTPKTVEPKQPTQPIKVAATKTPKPSPTDKAPTVDQDVKTQIIKLNGKAVGKIEQTPKQTTMTWTGGDEPYTFRFGEHVQHVEAVKLIDLNKTQLLSRHRVSWSSLSTDNIKEPALLIEVRQRFPPRENDQRALQKHRVRKFSYATRTRWMLLPLRQPWGLIWQETISDQHGDGFGGHTISGIKLAVEGKTRRITATKQEQLPARRSRCMRPKPYPVEYTQKGNRFTQTLRRPLKSSPCGR